MCKYVGSGSSSNAVEHYYNTGYSTALLDTNNPTIGITDASMTVDASNNLICRFTRDNTNSNSRYYNLNAGSPYILAAIGVLQANGSKHT